MKKKAYKKSMAVYSTVKQMFHQLNDCIDLGYIAMEKANKGKVSIPWEIKDLVARCEEVLNRISGTLSEDDFIWLSDLEDFLEDEMPENISRDLND